MATNSMQPMASHARDEDDLYGKAKIMPEQKFTPAELARAAFQDACEMMIGCEGLYNEAQEYLEGLRTRLLNGDDRVEPLQLALAHADEERTALILQWSQNEKRKAEGNLVNDDLAVADVIAEVLTESRERLGAPITPLVVARRSDAIPAADGSARLFVVQERPGLNDGGLVSGEVIIYFLRPAAFAPLNVDSIDDVCRSRGYIVETTARGSTRRNTLHEDELFVRVRSAYPAVPVLASAPNQERLDYFGNGVNARITRALRSPNERQTGYGYTGAAPAPAAGRLVEAKQIGKTTVRDGISRMTVHVVVSARESHNYAANGHPSITQALNDHVGLAESGTGRVESVEVVDIGVPDAHPVAKKPWNVVARFVLTYRLA